MRKPLIFILAIGFALFALQGCGEPEVQEKIVEKIVEKKAEPQTYKIASSLAITGPTSDVGSPYAKGIEDYVRYVNDEKLLGEDTLEVSIKDDGYKTEVTKRNFEEFLGENIVLYLNYSTGSTMGLKRDFEEEKIPVIPASFHAGNLVDSNYIFLPISSYSSQAIGLAEYVIANHKGGDKPKVAMFIHPSAFGRAATSDVKKAVEAGMGIELVEVVEHGKDLDNTAMLKRLSGKKVQYIISQTVQPPVATMLKGAKSLGIAATSFGEAGKITFLSCHYAGGPDLIALAGDDAEGAYWTTSYRLTTAKGPGTDAQLAMAKRYGRDDKLANSQNYTNGIQVTQIAVEAMRRVKAKGKKVSRETLYEELLAMNGYNAYYPLTTVGPVSFSKTDREGVDTLQLYRAEGGIFREVGAPFAAEFVEKIK